MEAAGLGRFMVSASVFTILLFHPARCCRKFFRVKFLAVRSLDTNRWLANFVPVNRAGADCEVHAALPTSAARAAMLSAGVGS